MRYPSFCGVATWRWDVAHLRRGNQSNSGTRGSQPFLDWHDPCCRTTIPPGIRSFSHCPGGYGWCLDINRDPAGDPRRCFFGLSWLAQGNLDFPAAVCFEPVGVPFSFASLVEIFDRSANLGLFIIGLEYFIEHSSPERQSEMQSLSSGIMGLGRLVGQVLAGSKGWFAGFVRSSPFLSC